MSSDLARKFWSRNNTSLNFGTISSQVDVRGGVVPLFVPEGERQALPVTESLPNITLLRLVVIIALGSAMWAPIMWVAARIVF